MQSPKKDEVINEMLQKTAESKKNKFELLRCLVIAPFFTISILILEKY